MKKMDTAEVYKRATSNGKFRVNKGKLYLYEKGKWKKMTVMETPIQIRQLFDPSERLLISSRVISEVIARMEQDPEMQMEFVDATKFNYVNLHNGIFDLDTKKMIAHSKEMPFSYELDFSYIVNQQDRKMPTFNEFAKASFPKETAKKSKLVKQMLGYVISDCVGAKIAFFLIGESNSGKSTILELIRKVIPETLITSVPLERLGNRFNLGKLCDAKVNVCTELSEKSFQSVAVFKIMTSNEIVTAEHKGKDPFEFRVRCKSVNAGNVLPDISNIDGYDAVLNRMMILLFPVSIPKDKQDVKLLEKLEKEKDAIFSDALDELSELYKNGFSFEIPEDTRELKDRLASRGNVVEEFINECCIMSPQEKVHMTELYSAFVNFCEDNFFDVQVKKSVFSQKIFRNKNLTHGKFRINGSKPLSGVKGLRLKTYEEFMKTTEETRKLSDRT